MSGTPETARENGKLGGRPKGTIGPNTYKAQMIREHILEIIEKEIDPMAQALVAKAKQGDHQAFKELFDRAMGRAAQAVDITSAGEPLEGAKDVDVEALAKLMAAELKKKKI